MIHPTLLLPVQWHSQQHRKKVQSIFVCQPSTSGCVDKIQLSENSGFQQKAVCFFFFIICSIIFVEGGRKMNRNLSLCLFLEPATHSFHTIKMRARYRIRKNILSLRSISFVPSFHCTGKRKFLICTFFFSPSNAKN